MRALLRSFKFAWKGIKLAFKGERNFKVGLICTAIVVVLGFLRHITRTDWMVLMLCCGIVLALEMVNSAIEAVVDLAAPQYHQLAKRAKDIAAGAVMLFAIFTVVIAGILFLT